MFKKTAMMLIFLGVFSGSNLAMASGDCDENCKCGCCGGICCDCIHE